MRVFELALYFFVFMLMVGKKIKDSHKHLVLPVKIGLAVVLVLLLIAHVWIDGARWQMSIVYGFTCIGIVGFLIKTIFLKQKSRSNKTPSIVIKVVKNIWFIICLLLMIVTGILLWLFPVNTIPKLTGPYAIGTDTYELTDTLRPEIYGNQPGNLRRIKIQVWYPADSVDGGTLTKWMSDGKKATSGIPYMFGFPLNILNYTALIDSNSYSGVPISQKEKNYPVVIISHGWTGFMNLHSDIAEMLASHGFIAISINHTYGAVVSVFDDGEVIYADYNALPDRETVDNFDEYSQTLVNTYALDDQLVLDYLEKYPSDIKVLENRIDMNRIGLLGHSTGGGGVVQTAIVDDRVKAVFGLDAWVEPIEKSILSKGLSIPSFFFRSQQWEVGPNNVNLKKLLDVSSVKPIIAQINGCKHQDLTMLYMYNPITKLSGFSGKLDNLKNASIQRDFILTFFNEMLLYKNTDVSALISKYDAISNVKEYQIKRPKILH